MINSIIIKDAQTKAMTIPFRKNFLSARIDTIMPNPTSDPNPEIAPTYPHGQEKPA
jgi:hypothetical protein